MTTNVVTPLLVIPPIPPPPSYKAAFDFDGDNKSDAGRWRGGNGEWAIKKSSDNQTQTYTLGSSSEVIVPANYDGDSKTDYAVFNSSTGNWTIYQSSASTNINHTLGQSGDIPVAADYDGDGKADVAVWRPSNGTWYYKSSIDGSIVSTAFGTSGDITAQADYDGDGKTDFAVFRPSNGYWYILNSGNQGVVYLQWGMNGDVPAIGDYDGDGKADVTIWRPSSGTWWSLKSSDNNNSWTVRTWGNYGDQVVPADYDGDGKTDFATWRPTTGVWYIIKSSDNTYDYKQSGISTDVAVPSAFLKKTGFQVSPYEMAKVRLSPKNATGGTNLYSQNIGWSSPLAGLSGRGLSAGLGISYNSLVWTKQNSGSNNSLYFDIDQSNVTPGFRLGYSVIEPRYTNTDTGKDSFILITSSGSRVELRQKAATNYFESVDSSYIQLKVKESQNPNEIESQEITLYMTDGMQMNYVWKGGAYRVTEIKDRNGNFITINHDELGLLRTITDTLGRIITVNYNRPLAKVG